jgi:hypothetical protein
LCLLALAAGCSRQRLYQIDVSQAEGFRWDGRLEVTEQLNFRVRPFFIAEPEWRVRRIEMTSADGQTLALDMAADEKGGPIVTLRPEDGLAIPMAGTQLFQEPEPPFDIVVDPVIMEAVVAERKDHPEKSDAHAFPFDTRRRCVPVDKQPFAEHADELGLLDWWAIALGRAEQATIEFVVPQENLRIVMKGHPNRYSPATLEVRAEDGTVIRRFEQQQVPIEELLDNTE